MPIGAACGTILFQTPHPVSPGFYNVVFLAERTENAYCQYCKEETAHRIVTGSGAEVVCTGCGNVVALPVIDKEQRSGGEEGN